MQSLLIAVAIGFVVIRSVFAGSAPKATPELIEKGKAAYVTNCVTCHGDNGDGEGPAGKYMNPKPRNFIKDKFKKGNKPEQLFQTITNGLDGTAMTSYKHLSEEERWGIAHYIAATFKKKK